MLFRRIKSHIEKENWFAVFIDVLIVVVGVFLGIQVANWNNARAEHTQEREIVLQLIAEAQETNVRIDFHVAGDAERLSAAIRAHEMLAADSLTQEETALLHQDLMSLGPWDATDHVTASLNRLIGADRLSLISNPDLQLAISRHYENVNERIIAFQNVGQMNLSHTMVINDRLDFALENDERIIVSSTDEILADVILERRVGQFVFTYQIFSGFHESARKTNQDYLNDLTQYANEKGWTEGE